MTRHSQLIALPAVLAFFAMLVSITAAADDPSDSRSDLVEYQFEPVASYEATGTVSEIIVQLTEQGRYWADVGLRAEFEYSIEDGGLGDWGEFSSVGDCEQQIGPAMFGNVGAMDDSFGYELDLLFNVATDALDTTLRFFLEYEFR